VAPSLTVSTRFTPRDGGGGGVGSWSRLPCGRPPFLVVPLPAVPSSSAALTRCHSPVVAAPPPHLTSSLASSVSSPPSLPFPRRRFHPLSTSLPHQLHPASSRSRRRFVVMWWCGRRWLGGLFSVALLSRQKKTLVTTTKRPRAQTMFVIIWACLVCDAALTRSRYW
jgi:hypothetical protein